MKQSLTFIPTMREVPTDTEIKSHQMLLRAGFIRQSSNGIYSYLPLAKRVLTKIEKIIREEIESIDAVEISLPTMQSTKIWSQTDRLPLYGPELIQFKDRNNREFLLAPSNEEAITTLVRDEIKSYKKLPFILYQIHTKFRDEERPRILLSGREFIMKDAYSFHADFESLDVTYEKIVNAYSKIFTRLGLNSRIVSADVGVIGGKESQEFIVLSSIGEDIIAYSNASNYASKKELAEVISTDNTNSEAMKDLEKVATPNVKTIDDVCNFFQVEASNCIKTVVFNVDEELIVVLVRGDHEISEIKLKNALKATVLQMASEEAISELLNCKPGSIGPLKLPVNVQVIADNSIKTIRNGIAGANEDGLHYLNVNPERDFAINHYKDIRYIQEGDLSPDGLGEIQFAKGIEVGHIFKLGTIYSQKLNAYFIDEKGQSQPFVMGCYGIGVSRLFATVAEHFYDDFGFVWPKQLSPYDLHLIPVNCEDEIQSQLANELYNILTSYRYEVLYDDRKERPGVKFTDSDLIGLPVRVTIGKRAVEGIVEVKIRKTGETFEWAKEELVDRLNEFFRAN